MPLTRDDDAALESLADERPGPQERYEQDEDEARLLALMQEHLTLEERQALWLRGIERMTVDDITRRLGLQGATGARGLLQTARRKLRAALGRTADTDEEAGA